MTGKNISRDILKQLIKDTDCNPFYVQQLAYYVWQNTSRKANSDIYTKSIEDLINSNYYLFVNDFEMMTESQINFMRALCDGIDKGFSRAEVICKYNLSGFAKQRNHRKERNKDRIY